MLPTAPLPPALHQLLLQAAALGIAMRVQDGNLQLEGEVKRLDAGQLALLRENKPAIVAFLSACDPRLAPGAEADQPEPGAVADAALMLVRVASVDGQLDPATVAAAVAQLARRHPRLAAAAQFAEARIAHAVTPAGAEAWARGAIDEGGWAPFQVVLLQHGAAQALVMAAAPHLADQVSLTLLMRELAAGAPAAPAPSFTAFARAEQRMLRHPRNQWRAQVAAAALGAGSAAVQAPLFRSSGRRLLALEGAAAMDLPRLAAEQRLSLLALVMAALDFGARLAGLERQPWFAVAFSNRSGHACAATIGPLERAMPVALPGDAAQHFIRRAADLQDALSCAHEHQDLPLPLPAAGFGIGVALAERGGAPLPWQAAALAQWPAAAWSGRVPAALWVRAGEARLELEMQFDGTAIDPVQAGAMLEHAGFLLGHARLVKECALSELPQDAAARAGFIAARRNDPAVIAATVCAIFAAVLGQAVVAPDDNFFELSGNSLAVAKVVSRIQREFALSVSFSDVFRHPTAAALSALLASRSGSAHPALKPLAPLAELPAAPQQVRYFASYNVALAGSSRMGVLHGEWDDADLFAAALTHVVGRHEFLRTAYFERDGVLMQRVLPHAAVQCATLEVAADAAPQRRQALEAALRARAFDLGEAPLVRAVLCRRAGGGVHSAVGVFSGIIDAYSEGLLEDELRVAYGLAAAGQLDGRAPLQLQYQDYARWQHDLAASGQMAAARRYWEQQFPLDYPAFHLPPKAGREGQPRQGEMRVFLLGEELSAAAGRAAAACESSLFGFLLANFFELAASIYRRRDVAVGLLYHGRENEEMEHMIGYFVDALCLRCDVVAGEDTAALVRRVNETLFASIDLRTYQYQQLAARFGRSPADAVFPVCGFHVNNVIVPGKEKQVPAGFTQQVLALPYAPKFDFNIYVHESNRGILLRMAYATTVVSTEEAEQIAAHFIALVSHRTRAHRKELA